MMKMLIQAGLIFLVMHSYCFAASESLLNQAAEITSQAREVALDSTNSLQKLMGEPSKTLKKTSASSIVNQIMEEAGDLNQSASSGQNSYSFNRSMSYLAALSAVKDHGFAQSCSPKHCCFEPCSEKDRLLLEARMALRTHYVGKYCSQRIDDGIKSHCIEETRSYCIFPSMKAKQIQEQGREQINKLAQALSSSEHNAVIEEVNWPLKMRVGRWHRYRVGHIETASWSWPLAAKEEAQTIFAICQYAEQCGALRPGPFKGDLQEGWLLINMPLEQINWRRVSHSLYLRGKCIENQCHWQIQSMGVVGSPDTITSDLEWEIGNSPVLKTSTGIQIRPGLKSIQFKLPGRHFWQSFSLPQLIPQASARVMHKNPRVLVWGSCELRRGYCHYYLSHQVKVHPISWGTAQQPNCRALTPQELLWVNWNDLRL